MVLVPISSTNTSQRASDFPATITFQATLSQSSRSIAPTVLFSRETQALENSPYGGVAQRLAREVLQEAAPACDGGCRTLLHVLFKELCGSLIDRGGPPGPLLGGEGSFWRAILA